MLSQRTRKQMEAGDLCARYCRANRLHTLHGAICRTGEQAILSSYCANYGKEFPLSGISGSGCNIFRRMHAIKRNLRGVYCQNWEINWKGGGTSVDADKLARSTC